MRRPKLKLDNLIAFLAVAEKRDFDRAGKELGLIPTVGSRMNRQSKNAQRIAEALHGTRRLPG